MNISRNIIHWLKSLAIATAVLGAASARPALADNQTACGAVLCLAGNGGTSCTPYLSAYFSIRAYTNGIFNPATTLRERGNWLAECSEVSASVENEVNGKYGGQEYENNSGGSGFFGL